MKKLKLEWRMLDREHVALVFDPETWRLFEITAADRQRDASEMVAEAVAGLLGPAHRV
jgi:hypothetical protein